MSLLRIFGLSLSIAAFLMIFFRLRRHSDSRFDVAVLSVFGTGMFLVSLFPGLLNLPTEIISLDKRNNGRILTLLIISTVILWFLLIYERGKSNNIMMGFDRLVRAIAVDDFFKSSNQIKDEAILIIIPAYNEQENLCKVIPSLPRQVIAGLPVVPLVIDDGSLDNTINLCVDQNVPLARNLINRGGGAALRVGFDIARRTKARVIVTMDGDGQHRSEDLEVLIEPILNSQADLVIGSRMLGEMERYSALRYWGVVLFGRMVSLLLGQKVTDPASGFRAFNQKVLEVCELSQDQYHTAELIIEAAKKKLRILEKPINIQKRISGQSKKGKELKYALCFLRTIIRTWWR